MPWAVAASTPLFALMHSIGVKLNVFSMHQGMLMLTGKEEEVRPLTVKWVTITMHASTITIKQCRFDVIGEGPSKSRASRDLDRLLLSVFDHATLCIPAFPFWSDHC